MAWSDNRKGTGMPLGLVLQFLGLPQLHLNDQPIATDRRKTIARLADLYINNTREGHRALKQADLAIPCARRLITL